MAKHLPPLKALRTFEAVARLNSFTLAAKELHVTRAAVSHQIKNLESYLGFDLIERHNRSISLTSAGAVALPKLREGFNNIADAVHLMESQLAPESKSVRVWAAPSFTSKWLIPRLNSFAKSNPDIDLDISSSDGLVEATRKNSLSMEELFRANNVDVMVRFGSGNHPFCQVHKLFSVEAVPLCSPKLLNNPELPLNKPEDLEHHTLLHDNTDYVGRPSWAKWLRKANVEGVNVSRGIHFNHISLGMAAAIDGQGILLSVKSLAQIDLDAGRLCIPFDLSMPLKLAYYVITPEDVDANLESVNAFRQWIIAEAKTEMANSG